MARLKIGRGWRWGRIGSLGESREEVENKREVKRMREVDGNLRITRRLEKEKILMPLNVFSTLSLPTWHHFLACPGK
jgi:hypothetical protein